MKQKWIRRGIALFAALLTLAFLCACQAPAATGAQKGSESGQTPIVTPSGGQTPDVTPSGGQTPDVTPSGGQTPDVTPSGGQTPDATPSGGQTPDATPSGGQTPDVTPSDDPTPDVTPSGDPTPDVTPSGDQTPDVTPSDDPTPDVTPSDDPTPDVTPSEPEEEKQSAKYSSTDSGKACTLTVNAESGSFSGKIENGVLTLTLSDNAVLTFTGTYSGGVAIRTGEEENAEIGLSDCTLIARNEVPPLCFLSAKNAEVSAKSGTRNVILDARETVEEMSGALYAVCDLKLKGQGNLTVTSENNNGVHSKDDLEVKNLTLSVDCRDNALKGNDSVTVLSGSLTLIARAGDAIKTSNSSVGESGKQKGTITVSGGTLNLYAACDGIDAAYDAVIQGYPRIQIYTDRYSEYSEEVTAKSETTLYIRATTTAYKYSVLFRNEAGETVWKNSGKYTEVSSGGGFGGFGGRRTYYYYEIEKPAGYTGMTVYVYASGQSQGQNETYAAASAAMTVHSSYDTVAFSVSGGRASFGWTNYTTTGGGGGGFDGRGGMGGGNREKGDYSTKGIKSGNAILITGGTLTVQSYDDALHAGAEALENGKTGAGSLTVSGGTLTLSSNDDGVHAEGMLKITDGTLTVLKSYEGLEGNVIEISGGTVTVTASDDGVNACSGSSTPRIAISGGLLDVTVPPNGDTDGIDSNGSYAQTGGVVITRGPNAQMSAALDADGQISLSGGTLIILGYGSVRTSGSVKSYSVSLQSAGSHTVKIGSKSYTFTNAYSYGRTLCYSDQTVTA